MYDDEYDEELEVWVDEQMALDKEYEPSDDYETELEETNWMGWTEEDWEQWWERDVKN